MLVWDRGCYSHLQVGILWDKEVEDFTQGHAGNLVAGRSRVLILNVEIQQSTWKLSEPTMYLSSKVWARKTLMDLLRYLKYLWYLKSLYGVALFSKVKKYLFFRYFRYRNKGDRTILSLHWSQDFESRGYFLHSSVQSTLFCELCLAPMMYQKWVTSDIMRTMTETATSHPHWPDVSARNMYGLA